MPDPSSPLARALGRIPTGLYVVATRDGGGPQGFLGSFLVQVGFEPPALCLAVGRDRAQLAAIRSSGRFAVSVLDRESHGLMKPFLKPPPGGSPFDEVEHESAPGGSPVLPGSLAWLECRLTGEHPTGDHVVLFATVEHARLLREGDPSIRLRKNGLEY